MKNLIFCGLLAAGCCFSAASQSKLSGHAQIMLQRHKSEMAVSRAADNTEVMALITMNKGFSEDLLKAKGLEVIGTYDDVSIVALPLSRAEEIADMPEVKAVSFGRESGMMMDQARNMTDVNIAHDGSDSDQSLAGMSFTGKGVITGLYDTGLDPQHAAFRNADGSSRVQAIFLAKGYGTASVTEYTTPDAIAGFTTDDQSQSHGTHVAGIMAGSKGIIGDYAQTVGTRTERTNGEIPYYGVAYNSDLVIGCGDFYDASILAGVKKVVDFAKAQKKPAVVNLSLGGNSGSHDPKSSVSKIMDGLGKDAIICIAAGNEGEKDMAIQKNFSTMGSAGKQLNTFITPENPALGVTYTAEFWSDSEKPFELTLVLYDKSLNKIVDSKKITTGSTTWDGSESTEFAKVYTSNSIVRASCGIDPETNRYYVILNNSMTYSKGSSFIAFGVNIVGEPKTSCYAYINSPFNSMQEAVFTSDGVSGYTKGSPDGSINGFGCGHNMVSVGAYVSRTSAPYLGSGNYTAGGTIGAIASFSSYGKTGDGRQLPHVCAPGAQIVSAISQYYYEALKMDKDHVIAYSDSHSHKNAYFPMQGTSMATPFAAGVIALWLEANPWLTIDEIHNIIEKTSDTDAQTNKDFKRFGAGKINAIEGLRMIKNSSLKPTLKDEVDKNMMYTQSGKNIQVIIPGMDAYNVTLYNLQGAAVLSAVSSGDTADVDATTLNDGIYILCADTEGGKITRKIVLK